MIRFLPLAFALIAGAGIDAPCDTTGARAGYACSHSVRAGDRVAWQSSFEVRAGGRHVAELQCFAGPGSRLAITCQSAIGARQRTARAGGLIPAIECDGPPGIVYRCGCELCSVVVTD